jgi:putative ABC transport system substrate-binding protein
MNRRAFLSAVTGGLLAAPLGAKAQPAGKLYRIGVLDSVGLAANRANLDAFRQGLRELGHVEGQHFAIEYRSAEGRAERFPDLATELVRLKVDVIVTRGTSAALGARHVTETIPIVMASSGDPVFAGLVASLARPGGNVTGLYLGVPPELAGQRLRLLKELLPGLSRVGVFLDSGDVYAQLVMREIETVAHATGVQLHNVGARRPAGLDQAFEAAVLDRVDALFVVEGILTVADLPRIVDFAAMSRLPAIYGLREFVDAGGLMAYGPDLRDLFRRAATYVHRILQGARASDLPVERPAKLALVINLKTARALGLTIPPSLLQRADEVIDP